VHLGIKSVDTISTKRASSCANQPGRSACRSHPSSSENLPGMNSSPCPQRFCQAMLHAACCTYAVSKPTFKSPPADVTQHHESGAAGSDHHHNKAHQFLTYLNEGILHIPNTFHALNSQPSYASEQNRKQELQILPYPSHQTPPLGPSSLGTPNR
jgi:hypothetical protein